MNATPRTDAVVDPFDSNPAPCPYAAEGKCPLEKEREAPRGLGHLSMDTLGRCGDCPGHSEFDLWGGPHFEGVRQPRPRG